MDMGTTTTMAMTMATTTGMTMDMGTATSAASAATTTAMSMGSMSMGSSSSSCKISMMWNWNTIDACFIARSWHITSKGMFAGSCIGVILLVMSLEMLRRAVKEYDRFLIRQYRAKLPLADAASAPAGAPKNDDAACCAVAVPPFRPNIFQQAVRALLHMVQFAVAYFVMLLAMYYNGYIIICIFIGAFLGSFVFQWETLADSSSKTSAANEATVCCG